MHTHIHTPTHLLPTKSLPKFLFIQFTWIGTPIVSKYVLRISHYRRGKNEFSVQSACVFQRNFYVFKYFISESQMPHQLTASFVTIGKNREMSVVLHKMQFEHCKGFYLSFFLYLFNPSLFHILQLNFKRNVHTNDTYSEIRCFDTICEQYVTFSLTSTVGLSPLLSANNCVKTAYSILWFSCGFEFP